jgi:hypothetical protein
VAFFNCHRHLAIYDQLKWFLFPIHMSTQMAAPCKDEMARAIDDINHEGFLDGNAFDANINPDLKPLPMPRWNDPTDSLSPQRHGEYK